MIPTILLALALQQPVECQVYKLSNPVVVQCGADTYDIPWQEWPREWGSWPSTRTFYYLVPESRERLQVYARRGFPAYVAVTTSPNRPAVVMRIEDAESLYEELKNGSAPVMFKALTVALGKLPNSPEYFERLAAETEWATCRRTHHRLEPCIGDGRFWQR